MPPPSQAAACSACARSLESNGYVIGRHIVPDLDSLKLAKVRPTHLQSYYSEKLDSELAPSSVRKHHNILHAALKHAVRMQLLATNPAGVVVPPRVPRGEMTRWTIGRWRR